MRDQRKSLAFSKAAVLAVPLEQLNEFESVMIKRYNPPLNQVLPKVDREVKLDLVLQDEILSQAKVWPRGKWNRRKNRE